MAVSFSQHELLLTTSTTSLETIPVVASGGTSAAVIRGTAVALNQTVVLFTFFFDQSAFFQATSTTARLLLGPNTVAVESSLCSQIQVGVELVVSPQADSSSASTAKTTQAIGSVVSVVTMSPTSAVQMARLGALQDISACIVDVDGETPIGFAGGSFTSMAVGTGSGLYLRGGIIGNGLIVLVGTIALALVILAWGVLESAKRSVQKHVATPAALLKDALQMGRLPSVYYPVYLVMSPSMVGFGVTLLFLSPTSGLNIFLGLATCIAFTVYSGLVTHNLRTNFACHLEETKPPARPNILTWLCHPSKHWVSESNADLPWRRRNRLYFDDYDCWWFCLIDLWSSLIIGVINGVTISSREVCAAQIGGVLLVFAVVFILGIWKNPTLSRSLRYYLNATNFVGLLSCCCLVGAVRTDNATLLNFSNWLMALVSTISIMKLFVDVMYVFYRYFRSLGSEKAYITTDTSHMNLAKTFNPAAEFDEMCSRDDSDGRHSHNNEMMDLILDDMIANTLDAGVPSSTAATTTSGTEMPPNILGSSRDRVAYPSGVISYQIVRLDEPSGGEQVVDGPPDPAKNAGVLPRGPAAGKRLNWDPFDDDDDGGRPAALTANNSRLDDAAQPLVVESLLDDDDDDWAADL